MAAPGKPSGSKWGSFLTSAVAGVESRLDNMLAEGAAPVVDDDEQPRQQQHQQRRKPQSQPQSQPPMSATTSARAAAPGSTSSPSNSRGNDRLQARLAKAMAAKSGQPSAASPRSSFDSRGSMDRPSADRPSTDRPSMDAQNGGGREEESVPEPAPTADATVATTANEPTPPEGADKTPTDDGDDDDRPAGKSQALTPAERSPDGADTPAETEGSGAAATPETTAPSAIAQSDISSLANDMEEIKARQHEEIQDYVERIDSLQSKLQYLSRNAAESAKKTASAAPPGSMDRKLAEKDEKIALLMEEGQKLSKSEHSFRTTIRKLRQQMAEREKQTEELRKSKDKALADADALRNRLDGSEEQERRQDEARKATEALQKEVDALKAEHAAKDEAMRKLEQDLRAKSDKAEAASSEAHSKALAAERERQRELEDAMAALRSEHESLADKARLEALEWSEKLERTAERSRTTEAEMKNELRTMEAKLEAMRAMAEEASSGSGGEAQVKLMRQIETLQSQYATASDNWQGIEASLLAKVANLEKERDEAQRRESEMRRKAREASTRSRKLEDELQDLKPELAAAKQELEVCREQLAALQVSSRSTETALEQAKADLEKMQRAAAREMQAETERRPWAADETPGTPSRVQSRPDSPLLSVPRTFSSDLAGFQIPSRSARRSPMLGSMADSSADGGRRTSSQNPYGRPGAATSATGLGLPPTPFSPFEPPPSEPANLTSPSLAEREDPSDDRVSSSPRNVAQDMISVSTVGAGPSVQLVERMSSAIRRLEAEKVAAKEEMARVCSQRDEARSDMLGLMKEIEAAKAASTRVTELEKELDGVNARYQTTLEMLGEKSELVEELKADVQDVKAMYRELVERTVK